MSRYVDAEWLNECFPDAGEGDWTYNRTAQGYIGSAPSIDIVRCRECTERDDDWCMYFGKMINPYDFCSYGERNSSEKPNNCEHITEDGVTCAKYPACDDCPDNPLNKVKGSERLVKGSEQTDCQTCKWWSSYGYCVHRECKSYEPQTERSSDD